MYIMLGIRIVGFGTIEINVRTDRFARKFLIESNKSFCQLLSYSDFEEEDEVTLFACVLA